MQKVREMTTRLKWTAEICADIAKGYKTRNDFFQGNGACYQASKRLGIFDEICRHMVKPKPIRKGRKWTKEVITNLASKYDSRWEFGKAHKNAYDAAIRLGILNDIFRDKPRLQALKHIFTEQEIVETTTACKTRAELRRLNGPMYYQLARTGKLDSYCQHMQVGYCAFDKSEWGFLYLLEIENLQTCEKVFKVGITNRNIRDRIRDIGPKKHVNVTILENVLFDDGNALVEEERRIKMTSNSDTFKDGKSWVRSGHTELYVAPPPSRFWKGTYI